MNKALLFGAVLSLVGVVHGVHAAAPTGYTLVPLPDMVNYHDFVVGPGKIELTIAPGQSQTVDLTIANRLGDDKSFSISTEDFRGSDDPRQSIILLGSDQGPYSLKNGLKVPASTIDIPFGQKAIVPVTITVPANAEPGGLYGSVIVSVLSKPAGGGANNVAPSNPLITRIATLFFVRIPGPTQADGHLVEASLSKGNFIWSGSLTKTDPIVFDLVYKNEGNVYLDPSGEIVVDNIFGATVGNVKVDPWFAMPQSLRFREVSWEPTFLFGRYVAHASIYRGYDTANATDTAEIVFWVIPWKIILIIFIGLIVFISLIKWIFSHVTFVSKKK